MNLAAIFGLGPLEIVIIVAVIVILFLPALLPKITKRAADTFRVVKDMTSKVSEDEEDDEED
jgi:Sec-independent protein translocase protein TatA